MKYSSPTNSVFKYRFYEEGEDWYRRQMPYSTQHQITIEKTPNYFVDKLAPGRVFDFNSSMRLMLIVRNPVDRSMSDYLQLKVCALICVYL